jgi:uncharacterized protein (TIGR02594 family)
MSAPKWLHIALDELGTQEVRGGENPRILDYHTATTLRALEDEVPWCSSFANWCIFEAGLRGTKSAAARSWLKWGKPCEARPGAITVLQRGTSTWQGHVGFLLQATKTGLWLLGGNQGDSVNIAIYAPSKLLGYRWPAEG